MKPTDSFPEQKVLEMNENNVSECVDLHRSVLYGVIGPFSEFPKHITHQERNALISMTNFQNLNLAARYYCICTQIDQLHKTINTSPPSKLLIKDEHGRNVYETYQLYKKLKTLVENRINEIRTSLSE